MTRNPWERWEPSLAEFESSWREARDAGFAWEPDLRLWLAALAPPLEERSAVLLELTLIDVEFRMRWRRPPWRVETLLKRLPELDASQSAAGRDTRTLELVLQEYRLQLGQPDLARPSRSDFIARFPGLLGLGEHLGMVESEALLEVECAEPSVAAHRLAPLSHRDFRLRRMLGAGGAARVYVAIQRSIDKVVAVKIQSAAWINDPAATQRMLTEAHMAARVQLPQATSVHGVGRLPSGALFLVMDFVPGMSLHKEIEQERRTYTSDEVTAFARQLRSLVDHVHRQGVLHGDISPANLLVDRTGDAPRLVLTDFGHAVDLHPGVVTASAGRGTAPFAAPDLVQHGIISRDTDRYSVEKVIEWLWDSLNAQEN